MQRPKRGVARAARLALWAGVLHCLLVAPVQQWRQSAEDRPSTSRNAHLASPSATAALTAAQLQVTSDGWTAARIAKSASHGTTVCAPPARSAAAARRMLCVAAQAPHSISLVTCHIRLQI